MAYDRPLSESELQQLASELQHLTPYAVQQFYEERYWACRLQPGTCRVPEPRTVQELVTAWNILRKWQG